MTAGSLAMVLKSQGHETLPPSALRVLAACQRLQVEGKPSTVDRLQKLLGFSSPHSVWPILQRLVAAGLLRRNAPRQSGLAVACVFIPGERR